jgi:hypothetical protein
MDGIAEGILKKMKKIIITQLCWSSHVGFLRGRSIYVASIGKYCRVSGKT